MDFGLERLCHSSVRWTTPSVSTPPTFPEYTCDPPRHPGTPTSHTTTNRQEGPLSVGHVDRCLRRRSRTRVHDTQPPETQSDQGPRHPGKRNRYRLWRCDCLPRRDTGRRPGDVCRALLLRLPGRGDVRRPTGVTEGREADTEEGSPPEAPRVVQTVLVRRLERAREVEVVGEVEVDLTLGRVLLLTVTVIGVTATAVRGVPDFRLLPTGHGHWSRGSRPVSDSLVAEP